MSPEEFQSKLLAGTEALQAKVKALETTVAAHGENSAQFKLALSEVEKAMSEIRKQQVELRMGSTVRRAHEAVSEACARHLGAIAFVTYAKQADVIGLDQTKVDRLLTVAKGILGTDVVERAFVNKTAVTSSDIPLPVSYSGEIVELVYKYGVARQLATVFPLGAGTVKLPKLSSDPTWGLIAASGTVPEKVPTAAWVTFTAEKMGGLIRLPSEIDEDSVIAMGQFLARYASRNIARVEDYQVFRSTGAGSGINGSAKGLTALTVDNSIVVNQASTKTKQSDATLANFRDLRNASGINGAVLDQACYMVHPTYEALFASFNTSATVTPYQRNAPGGPTLDGFPIKWVSVMPAYSTSTSASLCHALFGDPSFMYLGLRGGFRFDTSREAGFTTDEVLVRGLERLTVGYMATDAVAGLVTAAS